ncbi:uncharacterized protein LOC130668372 [Microplitis mediator]|uniref:uncharacterized protein LOC130668372 n=1 Tax=Microplitis mediator TaxID=375433 RepID=UPI00255587C1|nr:uncharacterized protein LOC130668372 [Microplitis mediator]
MNLPSDDVFGFTQQTAMILEGFNAGDLIPEFKKRNISTSVLSELTKDDFITLGASEELADNIVKEIGPKLRKSKAPLADLFDNPSNQSEKIIEIIKNSHLQLGFLQAFMNYNRVKLSKESCDFIIDLNKNTRASQALCLVTKCAIEQINNLQLDLHQLLTSMKGADTTKNQSHKYKFIGGIGLSICLIGSSIFVINILKKST